MKKLAILYIIAMSSCAPVPMISSIPEKGEDRSKTEYRYYNSESKVLYKITNDDRNLHIILNTTDKASILKILRTGLSIYFDVSGKKKKDVFVHYPYKLNDDKPDPKKEAGADQSSRSLNYYVSQIPRELIFSAYGTTEKIDLSINTFDISDSITVIKDNEITYELTIPLSRISNKGKFSLSKLSVGVVSGKFEIPNVSGGMAARKNSANTRAGGVSPAGVGGSPGNDDEIPQPGTGSDDMEAMGTPINFWFKVALVK